MGLRGTDLFCGIGVVAAALLLAVSGCGGGGGSDAPPNRVPVVSAGADVSLCVAEGNGVTLSGTSASDADGDPLTLCWTFASLPTGSRLTDADLIAAATLAPSFIPDVGGVYRLELAASDGKTAITDSVDMTAVVTFERVFGGPRSDSATAVSQTADGGYVVAGGQNEVSPEADGYLRKFDPRGGLEWEQTYGGAAEDKFFALERTADGGFILAGSTQSAATGSIDMYMYLVKVDASGNEQWTRAFGRGDADAAFAVQQTADGGFILAGSTFAGLGDFDVLLLKTDATGQEQWQRTFGGVGEDYGIAVRQAADGGYIVAGTTESFGAGLFDAYLVKTDAAGNEEWARTFGGSGRDETRSLLLTDEGGYLLAGGTGSFGAGDFDAYLVKTDAAGNEQWSRTFGGPDYDFADVIRPTADGGYVLAGTVEKPADGDKDMSLHKLDGDGNEEWRKTFGDSFNDFCYSAWESSDGGYILAGMTFTDTGSHESYLVKTGPCGN